MANACVGCVLYFSVGGTPQLTKEVNGQEQL